MKNPWLSSLLGAGPSPSVAPPATTSGIVSTSYRPGDRTGAVHDPTRGKHVDILPLELVTRARHESRSAFVRAHLGIPILLVRVEGSADPLSIGLFIASASAGTTLFPTVESTTTRLTRTSAPRPSAAQPAHEVVRRELQTSAHFAVLVRARTPGAERASLGRARTNDIVLQDDSVSKHHVWLGCDDHEQFFVTDAGSKNGTTVNDRRLRPDEPCAVAEGDRISVGRVTAVYCKAGALWDALSSTAP